MKIDRLKVYLFEVLLAITLIFSNFYPSIVNRSILCILMVGYAIILYFFVRKRKTLSIFKKEVLIWMIVFALIYVGAYYLLGLYFGFVNNPYTLSKWTFTEFIIPISIIVIATEYIRNILLAQELVVHIKKYKLSISKILVFITSVLVDLYIYSGSNNLFELGGFLTIIGFILFASISCNLLYNYISIKYGYKVIIIYRLITILYAYILPIVPDVYIFLSSFLRMIYPYIIYLFLEKNYSKQAKQIAYKKDAISTIISIVVIVVSILYVMLISCKFKYGLLVVGSGSMEGTLDVGDAIVYESFDEQNISNGQVIVFRYNNVKTIHRVVDIKRINGEVRYFTKGDANIKKDDDYRIKEDIIGLVDLRIKYIGYPTLWLHKLFEK